MTIDLFVLCGIGALLLRPGLAIYLGGMSRAKNAGGAFMRVVADFCVAVLAVWAVGAAILFLDWRQLVGWGESLSPKTFFFTTVCLIATGIPLAAVIERCKFFPGLAVSALVAGVVVPVAMQWSWSGWLFRLGYIDIGGAGAIHWAGAIVATVAVYFVGARAGKYNRDGTTHMIPGHSVPLASAGVLITLVGWIPYVIGCAAWNHADLSTAALDTLYAAAAGGAVALGTGRFRYGTGDIYITYAGLLGGLVAITGCAGNVSPAIAVLIGAVAGLVVPEVMIELDLRRHIDDPAAVIAVHGIGGLWGVLAAAIFSAGSVAERFHHLGAAVLGLVAIGALAAVSAGALFYVLRAAVGLRLRDAEEFDGVDLSEHDLNSYPDFQQTMIKSYHLRET